VKKYMFARTVQGCRKRKKRYRILPTACTRTFLRRDNHLIAEGVAGY
jgi:hypothetical protein